jgi:TPR repeat protein
MDKQIEEILGRAEAGEINAQINLAERYLSGEGVPKSHERAAEWYRRSAEQGFPQGQVCLGVCYERGIGVKRDREKAVEWYKKAAEQGDRDAKDRLGQLLDKDGRIRPAGFAGFAGPAGPAMRKPLGKAVMIGLAVGALAGSPFGGIGVIVGAVAGFFAGLAIDKRIKSRKAAPGEEQ